MPDALPIRTSDDATVPSSLITRAVKSGLAAVVSAIRISSAASDSRIIRSLFDERDAVIPVLVVCKLIARARLVRSEVVTCAEIITGCVFFHSSQNVTSPAEVNVFNSTRVLAVA